MRLNILNNKLPSLLGLSIIAFGIVLTLFLNQRTNILKTNASSGENPKKIQITNVTDSSFTITYTTDSFVIGSINFGENPNDLNQKILDERDTNSQLINSYKTHSFIADNLKPDTEYYYTISSGKNITSNNGNPFKVRTTAKIIDSPTLNTQFQGKIINPDGSNLNDGIVIVKTEKSNPISTIVKDGNFNIDINMLLSTNLQNYLDAKDLSIIDIEISSGELTSLVRISGNQKSPLPIITLSNNYDFTELSPSPVRIINSKNVKFPKFRSKLKAIQNTFNNSSSSISPTSIPAR